MSLENLVTPLFALPVATRSEVLAVSTGLKPGCRLLIHRRDIPNVQDALGEIGLTSQIMHVPPQGWGHVHASLEENTLRTKSYVFLFVSRDNIIVANMAEAESRADTVTLGRLLGYPQCCVKMDRLYQHIELHDHIRVARASRRANWKLNVFLNECGTDLPIPASLISHFPCSLNCPSSVSYARQLLSLFERMDKRVADRLVSLLRLPILLRDESHDQNRRGLSVRGAILVGVAIEKAVLYRSWISLKSDDPLEDAVLDHGNKLYEAEEYYEISGDNPNSPSHRLEKERWHLVRFQ